MDNKTRKSEQRLYKLIVPTYVPTIFRLVYLFISTANTIENPFNTLKSRSKVEWSSATTGQVHIFRNKKKVHFTIWRKK